MRPTASVCPLLFASVFPLAALACGGTAAPKSEGASGKVAEGIAGPPVVTQRNDNLRSGANLSETTLTTANVGGGTFGKKYTRSVRGSIYAQPLYVPNLTVNSAAHNVTFVATMHDYVYAFDADDTSANAAPLWSRALGSSVSIPDSSVGGGSIYMNFWGEIGIVSTPVISVANGAMYVVAMTKTGSTFAHTLYKLSLTTGADLATPVVITDPSGWASSKENQRSSLLLLGNNVVFTFGSFGDNAPFSGYVFAYDATTLARTAMYRASDAGQENGIWMGGTGPASDGTDIFFITGNGQWQYNVNSPLDSSLRVGESIVRMNLAGSTLAIKDWFTPNNHGDLNAGDGDLGASGAVIIPAAVPDRVIGGGKEGIFFLMNKSYFGYTSMDDHTPIQKFRVRAQLQSCTPLASSGCNHMHGSPVFWTGPMGQFMYVWPENDFLRAFRYDPVAKQFVCGSMLNGACDPAMDSMGNPIVSTTQGPEGVPGGSSGMPGGFLSVSANGSNANTGIVWASHAYTGDAAQEVVQGVLRAYDAATLTELWNSRNNPGRDDSGAFAKFVPPTIAGGKVFEPSVVGLSGRVKLTDTSPNGPALAALGTTALVVAWRGSDSHINVTSSTDGFNHATTTVLPYTTPDEVSLAGDGTRVYLAWTGSDGHMNVLSSTTANFSGATLMTEKDANNSTIPFESSNQAPALGCGNGKVFIAWRHSAFGWLNVMSSSNGTSFSQSSIYTDTNDGTLSPMGLYYADSRLYLTWLGSDRKPNVMSSSNDGASFANKVTLGETSGGRALLVGKKNNPGTVEDLHFVWADYVSGNLSVITAENPVMSGPLSFTYKQVIFDEASSYGMAATRWNDKLYLAWTSADGAINWAKYSPGEFSAYGL